MCHRIFQHRLCLFRVIALASRPRCLVPHGKVDEMRDLAADIITVLVHTDAGISAFSGNTLFARPATVVFRMFQSLTWMKNLEVTVMKLAGALEVVANTGRLFNIAMGIAKQRFLYVRGKDIDLVKPLIEFKPEE